MFLIRLLFFSSTFVVAVASVADLWENTSLFSDTTSSTVSIDDLDLSDPLSSVDNSGSSIFMDNDETDPIIFAENDCAIPLVSSPIGRIRRRSNQCSTPSSQLQLPTLNDIPLEGEVGSALDSLKNEEVCSPLVFGARNIPICSSGNLLDKEFIWADYGYSLKHCTLCKFHSSYHVRDGSEKHIRERYNCTYSRECSDKSD